MSRKSKKKVVDILRKFRHYIYMDKKPTFKEWLKITGQTYKDFAQKMGMKYQAIERIANNKDTISFKKACSIWKATGYEVRLISLYPNLGLVLEDLKHIRKEDVIAHHSGCDKD